MLHSLLFYLLPTTTFTAAVYYVNQEPRLFPLAQILHPQSKAPASLGNLLEMQVLDLITDLLHQNL